VLQRPRTSLLASVYERLVQVEERRRQFWEERLRVGASAERTLAH
jgi:hypothetical protein